MPQSINNTVQKTQGLITPTAYNSSFGNFGTPSSVTSVTPKTTAGTGVPYRLPTSPLNNSFGSLNNTNSTSAYAPMINKTTTPTTTGLMSTSYQKINPLQGGSSVSSIGGYTGQAPTSGTASQGGYSDPYSGGFGASITPAVNTAPQGSLGMQNTVGQKAPAGMEYDGQGQLVPISAQAGNQNSYAGLVSRAADLASKPSDSYTSAQKAALGYQDELKRLKEEEAGGIGAIERNGGTPMSQALGEMGAINRLYAAREGAAATAFQGASSLLPSATAQQNAQINGTLGAAGLAAPQQVSYGNQYLDPTTGRSIGGGGAGQAGNFINDLAMQVMQGTAYNDAVSQLPNPAMAPMLLQAIRAQNPNFNITDSNQNAGARNSALQQNATSVRPMVNSQQTAIQHLDSLQQLLNNVNYSNIPLVNGIRNWFSSNVVNDPNIQKVQSEIGIVRSEVAKVLGGGTVTVNSQQEAEHVVPSNISPENFEQVKNNIQQLMQSKIDQSTNLDNIQQFGQQPSSNGTNTSASLFSW